MCAKELGSRSSALWVTLPRVWGQAMCRSGIGCFAHRLTAHIGWVKRLSYRVGKNLAAKTLNLRDVK